MKLYYSPGACSQAPHILLHEIGLPHQSEQVDLRAKKVPDGGDYLTVNPKGAVPALELESGEVLTENAVILQFLGDRTNWPEVLPPMGDFRRYRVLEMVNFITTELHKRFGVLFNPNAGEDTRNLIIGELEKKLSYVDEQLGEGPFLFGEQLTLPDPYLFVMTGWAEKLLSGLDRWPNLKSFRERMMQRDAVRIVLGAEGLLREEAAG